jgi:hypothetical protein
MGILDMTGIIILAIEPAMITIPITEINLKCSILISILLYYSTIIQIFRVYGSPISFYFSMTYRGRGETQGGGREEVLDILYCVP